MFLINRAGRAGISSHSQQKLRPSGAEVRRLFGFLKPYSAMMSVAIVSLLLGSALNLVFPWVIQNVVDSVLVQRG